MLSLFVTKITFQWISLASPVFLFTLLQETKSAVAYGKADHSKCNLCRDFLKYFSWIFVAKPGHCDVSGSESHEIQTMWQPEGALNIKWRSLILKLAGFVAGLCNSQHATLLSWGKYPEILERNSLQLKLEYILILILRFILCYNWGLLDRRCVP